jgi:hypothetical protein
MRVSGLLFRSSAGLMLGAMAGQSGAQSGAALVTGVPLSATVVSTNGDPAQTSIVKYARASNGSTYTELPAGPRERMGAVSIMDVPNRRYIMLDPNTKTYSVQMANIPKMNPGQVDDAQLRERIEKYRATPAKHFAEDGREGDTIPLGFRTVDGFVEYGTKTIYTKLPQTSRLGQKVWEQWYVPALYIPADNTGFDDAGNAVRTTKFTDIKASEPDAHLFEIPKDYVPAPARTPPN